MTITENLKLNLTSDEIKRQILQIYNNSLPNFILSDKLENAITGISKILSNPGERTGIFITGPTGTGKTVLAEVIVNLLSDKLHDKWLDEEMDQISNEEQYYLDEIKKWEDPINGNSIVASNKRFEHRIYCTEQGLKERRNTIKQADPVFVECDGNRVEEVYGAKDQDKYYSTIKALERHPYLFLDDIGVEQAKVSVYGRQVKPMETVILARYGRKLNTIITSNLTIDQIKEYYGERVYSRLYERFFMVDLGDRDLRTSKY